MDDVYYNLESRIGVLESRLGHAKWENERLRKYLKKLKDELGIELPKDIDMLVEMNANK